MGINNGFILLYNKTDINKNVAGYATRTCTWTLPQAVTNSIVFSSGLSVAPQFIPIASNNSSTAECIIRLRNYGADAHTITTVYMIAIGF